MTSQDGIRIGTHYEYPFGGMATRVEWLPQGPDDWRRDLAKIKETGFDSIRIRIGLDSSLDEIGQLLDLCQELGLGVLFGFATFYVHDDFIEAYPDAKIVDRKGIAYPVHKYDYRWQRACINHPEYRRQRNRLVEACITRFVDHPSIIDWDIHNEPSIGPGDHSCYCTHTVARYQQDLATRFDSIDALNRRWGTRFGGFDEVEPPRESDPDPGGFWRDWREFMARNLSEFLLEGKRIIQQHAPHVRVSYNYTHPYVIEHNAQDWWVLPQLDYASSSHYWGSSPRTAAQAGSRIALLKALAPDAEVWLTETQGGPFEHAGALLWRGIYIEAEVNQVFSHASRALYFYRWEPLMAGPEPWINGMVEADTYDTERRLATQRIIAELRPHAELIASGRTVRPRIGLYVTRDMVWSANAHNVSLSEIIVGLYGLFLDLGYEVTFVPYTFTAECDLDVVAVPYTLSLSTAEQQALQGYMERGGRVIAELPMTNLEQCKAAGTWLGLDIAEWIRPIYFLVSGWSMNDAAGRFGGFAFHDRVLLNGYAGNPVATYRDNGAPALIAAGPGGRLLIPTFALGRSYHSSLHQGVRRLIRQWLPADLAPDIVIEGAPEEYRALIEARVVESELGTLLFVINRSGYDWEVTVTPRGYAPTTVKLPTHGAVRRIVTRVPVATT